MPKQLTKNNEWIAFIEECKAIVTETIFNYRWTLIEGYHKLGSVIIAESIKTEKADIVSQVTKELNISYRTVSRAVQFVKKFPDINKLPLGKNISWHKICNKYLPESKEKEEKSCEHLRFRCVGCQKIFTKEEILEL